MPGDRVGPQVCIALYRRSAGKHPDTKPSRSETCRIHDDFKMQSCAQAQGSPRDPTGNQTKEK